MDDYLGIEEDDNVDDMDDYLGSDKDDDCDIDEDDDKGDNDKEFYEDNYILMMVLMKMFMTLFAETIE